MILLDANLLVYAYNTASKQHEAASAWLKQVFGEPELVALSSVALVAFLRLSTNPRAFAQPYLPTEAVEIASAWLQRPNVIFLQPGERHWQILSRLIIEAQARGDLVTDAHLAALAIEHGATLCTTDRDFTRFPGLRFLNPLEQR